MKRFFLLFALVGVFALTSNAQDCKSAKKAMTSVEGATCTKAAAAKAASLDMDIEKRVCSKSGTVSYVKKSVCPSSGKVSYSDVEYCSKSAKFVNVSPSKAKKDCSKTCTKKAKTSAKATKVSTKATKNCSAAEKAACAKKCTAAEKAACNAKKASAEKTTSAAKVKLVKNEK